MKESPQNHGAPRAPEGSSSVYAALASRARHTTSSRLVALETTGFAVALSVLAWMPSRIALALPFVALSMVGLWGAAEHAKRETWWRPPARTVLSGFQIAAAAVGTLAAATALYLLAGRAIGTVIS
ncbi:MAG: hypothetical protein ACSLFK_08670 [Gemmatimonadaceae bacterium]